MQTDVAMSCSGPDGPRHTQLGQATKAGTDPARIIKMNY